MQALRKSCLRSVPDNPKSPKQHPNRPRHPPSRLPPRAMESESRMAARTVTGILTNYFNTGDVKVPAQQWLAQLKELTDEEKLELARDVCVVTGDSIKQ